MNPMTGEGFIDIFSSKDFKRWLSKNHDKEKKIGLILYKKHTGKNSPSHRELMNEAICFGWIDTTIRRVDENRYIRFFCRRSKNSRWSNNTLGYARELIKKGLMTPAGLHFYKEGLKKPTHDDGIPSNPEIPQEMILEFKRDKKLKEFFDRLTPSIKRMHLRWILRAKRQETRKKRIKQILKELKIKN